jgi:hypothetical protein
MPSRLSSSESPHAGIGRDVTIGRLYGPSIELEQPGGPLTTARDFGAGSLHLSTWFRSAGHARAGSLSIRGLELSPGRVMERG